MTHDTSSFVPAGIVRDQGGDRNSLIRSLLDNKFVLDVRGVVLEVDVGDGLGGALDFGPPVDLQAQVLLDHVRVGVADADSLALLHNIELLIKCHHLDAAVLVTDDALGHAIERASVVASAFANHAHRVHPQVHVHASAWLQLRHGNENRFAKRRSLLLRLGSSIGAWLLLLVCGFHHFSLRRENFLDYYQQMLYNYFDFFWRHGILGF